MRINCKFGWDSGGCISRLLAILLSIPLAAAAQSSIPPGTILPVSLDGALNSVKVRAGRRVQATVMQNIPGTPVRRRAKVEGRVVETSGAGVLPARLEIVFDAVKVKGRLMPLRLGLRALASPLEVDEAQTPEEEASRGLPPEMATTRQIGGEEVYRGGGPVAIGVRTVGWPAPYGILGLPLTGPDDLCRGVVEGNRRLQAWWLFSTQACGVYGYTNIRIYHAGRKNPLGTIILTAAKGRVMLYGGSGLLLRVLPEKAQTAFPGHPPAACNVFQ